VSRFTHDQSLYRPTARQCPDLCRAEKLLIRGLRRWLRGGPDWERAKRDATRALKPAQAMVFVNGLMGLADAIDTHARRRLRLRLPQCERVSSDERALLAMIGALQHDRFDHAHAVLAYLVRPAGRNPAMAHALTIARTLGKGGLPLAAPRAVQPPARCRKPDLRAVA